MNIFKFYLLVESKSSVSSISHEVTNIYASKSTEIINYKKYVTSIWDELGKEKMVALYPSSALMVCCKKARCTYFFVDTDKNHEIDQMTIEVFVISELEDINAAYNLVYQDIKKKMKNKFKISLTEKQAFLYVYDGCDIVASHVVVKANIITFTGFRTVEIIRGIVLLILAAIFVIVAAISENKPTICNVMYSLAASSIFFIITEFLIKISRTQQIEIKDLTNWIKTEDFVKKIENQDIELSNPNFEEE